MVDRKCPFGVYEQLKAFHKALAGVDYSRFQKPQHYYRLLARIQLELMIDSEIL